MKVLVCPSRLDPKRAAWAQNLAASMNTLGDEARCGQIGALDSPDAYVTWGFRNAMRAKLHGTNVLIMERGYLGDRMHWTSLRWGGLNGKGKGVPCLGTERFEQFAHLMKPWTQRETGYVLLLGQVPTDASLIGLRDYHDWLNKQVYALKSRGFEVRYRRHPSSRARGVYATGARDIGGTLEAALDGARFAVTYNSNSAVEAVCAGVPCVTFDRGSMAWDVTSHDYSAIVRPDRTEWAQWLAWQQWSPLELADGTAWGATRHFARD